MPRPTCPPAAALTLGARTAGMSQGSSRKKMLPKEVVAADMADMDAVELDRLKRSPCFMEPGERTVRAAPPSTTLRRAPPPSTALSVTIHQLECQVPASAPCHWNRPRRFGEFRATFIITPGPLIRKVSITQWLRLPSH